MTSCTSRWLGIICSCWQHNAIVAKALYLKWLTNFLQSENNLLTNLKTICLYPSCYANVSVSFRHFTGTQHIALYLPFLTDVVCSDCYETLCSTTVQISDVNTTLSCNQKNPCNLCLVAMYHCFKPSITNVLDGNT